MAIVYYAPTLLFYPDYNVPSQQLIENEFIIDKGIDCLFCDRGHDTPIILYSHGNAGNIFNRSALFNLLPDLSLFMYDYRGFGRHNNFTTTTHSIIEDGETVYNYISTNYPGRNIILLGESMGSAVTWHLAKKYSVSGIIIKSGYSSLSKVIDDLFSFPLGYMLSWLIYLPDNLQNIELITCPVLIIHANDDRTINISHAHDIIQKIPHAQLIACQGGYNFHLAGPRQVINDWLNNTYKNNK